MLDAFRVEFGTMARHAHGDEQVDDEAMAGAHPRCKALTCRSEKYTAIELGGREALAFEPGDALDRRRVRDAEAPGDIGRPRLALGLQKVVDQLDIILEHRRGAGGTRPLKTLRQRRSEAPGLWRRGLRSRSPVSDLSCWRGLTCLWDGKMRPWG